MAWTLSLGHGAFYGLGAYTMAVLMCHAGVPAYAGIFATGVTSLAAGYLFRRRERRRRRGAERARAHKEMTEME
jgi:ABC-type branched-subunit amino acid transport system permease subunit